jgi:hypothetical protein
MLTNLSGLTPGDFTVAVKKAKILGYQEPVERVSLLRQELKMKELCPERTIGFTKN